MKFLAAVLLTALFAFTCPLFFPWWSFVASSFLIAIFINQKPLMSFAAGFVAVFLLWSIHALIIDNANAQLLSGRMAMLLPLNGSGGLLIVLTGVLGGLVSAMAALTGSFVQPATIRRRQETEEEVMEESNEDLEVS